MSQKHSLQELTEKVEALVKLCEHLRGENERLIGDCRRLDAELSHLRGEKGIISDRISNMVGRLRQLESDL